MLHANQTLEQMAQSWLERKLRLLVFGRPTKGEPAYQEECTFKSTYPSGYVPDYNDWIRRIHEGEAKKFSNRKERLQDKKRFR